MTVDLMPNDALIPLVVCCHKDNPNINNNHTKIKKSDDSP